MVNPLTRLAGAARRSGYGVLAVLLATTAGLTLLSWVGGPEWVPPSVVALPVVAGGLLLGRRRELGVLVVTAAAGLLVLVAGHGMRGVRPGNMLVFALIAAVGVAFVSSRERVGVTSLRGESMLLELRQQLRRQGELPPLPRGWRAEVVLRSAGGTAFGGDFLVSTIVRENCLELVLVDVSGKGLDAGTRALQLAGALGGLLGEVPPDQFLPAANRYLLRQRWSEGFATAVHVAIDLARGAYRLGTAGHPPAAQFTSGTGLWALRGAEGPVLGVVEDAAWTAVTGTLGRGDALLLYTDGLIEVPGRDLALGIDRLLGHANRLVISSFDGGAETLVTAVAPHATDDRALVLLWRT